MPLAYTSGLFGSDQHSSTVLAQDSTQDGGNVSAYEDFEDGNYDGWEAFHSDSAVNIVEESFYGNHSVQIDDDNDQAQLFWTDGQSFDLGNTFEISGTYYAEDGSSSPPIRFGINDPDADDVVNSENQALVNIEQEHNAIYLATHYDDAVPADEDKYITDAMLNQWNNFRLQIDSGKARLKVWESGTSEPSEWMATRDYDEFEGQFYANSGNDVGERRLLLDEIDAGGHSISGQVIDGDGNPVDNATVETIGVDFDGLKEELNDTSADLEAEADELLDQVDDVEPDSWNEDYDLTSHFQDANGEYLLAHQQNDWGLGQTLAIDSNVDAPRLSMDSDSSVYLSVWDATNGSGILGNQVDNSFPGSVVKQPIVVEQIGAGGETIQSTTHDPEVIAETTGGRVTGTNKHYGVDIDLSVGFYRAYPEGSPEKGYTFVVGDAQELIGMFQDQLRTEAGELTERSEELSETVKGGLFERRTTTTTENGTFNLRVQQGVERATVQTYRADGQQLTEITGPSFGDLRDIADGAYNGSFVVASPQRFDVPNENVTIQAYRTDELPFRNIEDYDSLQEWLQDQRMKERLDEISEEYDERLSELDRARLEQVYSSHRLLVETIPSAEDNYLSESSFDEIQDGEDLSNDELETETELMQSALIGAGDLDNIDDLEPPEIPEDPIDVTDGTLNAEYPIPGNLNLDSITPEIHYSDGTSEQISDEYWSVDESMTPLGTDTLVIEDYPLGDGVSAFDVRIMGASENGLLDDRISGVNPDFAGELVDIDAIDFSTLAPSADERVYVSVDAASGQDTIVGVDVFGPNGQQLGSEVSNESDQASFRTNGEGAHHVRLTLESTSGHQFTVSESIRALEQSRSDPATVRIGKSTLGPHAVVGERLESARVDSLENPSIDAIAEADDAPGEIHIKPGDNLRGTSNTLDVNLLHGSDEEQVRRNAMVYVHIDGGLGDKDISWVNSNPITQDGQTRWGEVEHGESDGKSVLVTVTDERGQASIEIERDAGPIARMVHWMSYSIPGSDLLTSIFAPLYQFILTVAAEPVTTVSPVSPTVPVAATV
ncbi:hypothetical protein [Natrialba asiatica]|nr:hypothetical protein [Natrialba asiatica]